MGKTKKESNFNGKLPEEYTYNACNPRVKEKIFDLTVNGNGTRAIERNKEAELEVILVQVEEVEMDEMWSFVHDKSQQYWIWWAIDHNTGEPLAYVFGTREHANLDELRDQLNPFFDIKIVYADGNPAYASHITESQVITGKRNTQNIENKHTSLRTWCSRLVRKGIRFSKSHQMHRIVLGIIINFCFFNCKLW